MLLDCARLGKTHSGGTPDGNFSRRIPSFQKNVVYQRRIDIDKTGVLVGTLAGQVDIFRLVKRFVIQTVLVNRAARIIISID